MARGRGLGSLPDTWPKTELEPSFLHLSAARPRAGCLTALSLSSSAARWGCLVHWAPLRGQGGIGHSLGPAVARKRDPSRGTWEQRTFGGGAPPDPQEDPQPASWGLSSYLADATSVSFPPRLSPGPWPPSLCTCPLSSLRPAAPTPSFLSALWPPGLDTNVTSPGGGDST